MPVIPEQLGAVDYGLLARTSLRPKASVPLLALIVTALVLVVVQGALLMDRIGTYRDVDIDNRSWLVAQLEVDHKELRLALLQAQIEAELTPQTDSAVRRAFDIYYSRVMIVTAALSPVLERPIHQNHFAQIEVSRDAMAALIDGSALLRPQDIDLLTELTQTDVLHIREVTSEALMIFTGLAEKQRLEHRDLLIRLGQLMGLLVILMTIAVVLAILISREAARRAQSVARIASNLRRTFEASLDGVVVSDGAGTITYLNAAALYMFGQGPSDLLGTSITDTIMRRLVRGGDLEQIVDTGRHRLTGLHRSGREFPIEVSIISDHDSEGRLIFIGFLRDITDEVEAETRLRDARDQARRDAAAKSRFLAVMSHEMRTPLHGVLAALDLISTETLSATDQRFLATARACGHSALDQVDEVLEITRSGASEVTVSTFDPRRLAAELLADLQPLAIERGNRLILTPPSTGICPPVLGWKRGFLLVLRNLISNAVKFTRDGEIVVTIACTQQPDGRLALDVEVSDTGGGIDPTDHDRVFRKFETLDRGDHIGSGGIGLGLAIARSAVVRMGGDISLKSALGHGCQFSFRLMLAPAPANIPSPTKPSSDLPAADVVEQPHEPRLILVVDDNPVNLALMAEMLRRLGHLPETAQDGPSAIALAHDETFDLIMMDIGMPGMDGMATTRAIRAGGASAFSPVVGVTALVLEEDRTRILDAGMQDILGKPLGLAKLRAYLSDFFADHFPSDDGYAGFDEMRTLMGDTMMEQLVEAVLQDTEAALAVLRTLDAACDMQVLQQALHRAAGSAGMIGVSGLSEALRTGELAARAGDIPALGPCEAYIESERALTIERMRIYWPGRAKVWALAADCIPV